MEEILASIRRIISEDEEEQPGVDRAPLDALASAQETVRETVAETVGAEVDLAVNADENSLSKMLDIAQGKRTVEPDFPDAGEFEPVASEEPISVLEEIVEDNNLNEEAGADEAAEELETKDVKMVKQAVAMQEAEETLIDNETASAATAAFGNLTRSVRVADDEGQTLEALVTVMLKPMVKDWLDTNLSRIVEQKVEDEVQRLSRRA